MSFTMLAFFNGLGTPEMIIILIIGIILFGKRLPEVGRSLGKGIVEFKKGLKGIEDEVETQASRPEPRQERVDSDPPRFDIPRA